MSQGNQSFLRFSLEESVWFQRGQEVEELVSISLDPNITIQENDQYVLIRGSLDLTGEYKRQSETAVEDNQWNAVQKWIHNVEEREEGISEFAHQFPVDITIPTYRVRDLSEIDVVIETFDYVLPERSCLKLTAELNITGLFEEPAVGSEEEEVVAEVFPRFHGEVLEPSYRDQEEEYEDQEDDEVESENDSSNDSEYESFEAEARKQEKFFTEPTFAESSSYQTPAPEIHFAAFRSEVANEQQPQEAVPYLSQQGGQEEVSELEEESQSQPQEQVQQSPTLVEKLVNKVKPNKKSMSISEFLARKEGEEHAKLKVCIVQNGESVETLAERYDVSIQQLLKVNNLELNQDVHEGQVLYVPQVVSRK
ncbi:MAG TPA: stage VI sporulation protein D [Pseudoneobacillus sp.]|nr:stage VI sporulation protein D [Pseudoneobacillus sp.]